MKKKIIHSYGGLTAAIVMLVVSCGLLMNQAEFDPITVGLMALSCGFVISEVVFKKRLSKKLAELRVKSVASDHVDFTGLNGTFLEDVTDTLVAINEKAKTKLVSMQEQVEAANIQLQLTEKEKRNTEAVIRSIVDAVVVTDSLNRVVITNKPAADLFGFDLEGAKFKQVDVLLRNSNVSDLIRGTFSSRVTHRKVELEFEHGGETKYFKCIFSGIPSDNGELAGVVSVFHDVSQEKEISKMKNDFVSHVSHELKTPLASITAYAEMLADGEANDDETREQFLSVIQSQAQRLNRLIEDILNVSRIESGLVKVNKEKISVAMLIKDAVDMIKSYAAEKNITVDEPASVVFDQVYADRDMISQVVVNLLSNAVKYTPNGGRVTITADVNEVDNFICVRVKDTGVGIPKDDVAHVFDKFFRVKANNKVAKGTGLGLNLVKQIVEKVHGGKIFVESIEGEGSIFGFELQLFSADQTVAAN